MMNKKYKKPEMDIISLDFSSIIATSGEGGTETIISCDGADTVYCLSVDETD